MVTVDCTYIMFNNASIYSHHQGTKTFILKQSQSQYETCIASHAMLDSTLNTVIYEKTI